MAIRRLWLHQTWLTVILAGHTPYLVRFKTVSENWYKLFIVYYTRRADMAGMCSNQQMQLVASDLTRDGMPHSIHETSAFCVLHALPTRKVPARVRTKNEENL